MSDDLLNKASEKAIKGMGVTGEALILFRQHMAFNLAKNYVEKGDSWKSMTIPQLERLMNDEMEEYDEATDNTERANELVDIANFCMMLYSKHLDGE